MKTKRSLIAIILAVATFISLPFTETSAKEIEQEPFELPINGATGLHVKVLVL